MKRNNHSWRSWSSWGKDFKLGFASKSAHLAQADKVSQATQSNKASQAQASEAVGMADDFAARSGSAEVFPAAVVLLIAPDDNGRPSLLLTKRASGLGHHAGEISFPGGVLEHKEAPDNAAIRETAEEIGVAASEFTLLGSLPLCYTGSGFIITPFVGLASGPLDVRPNKEEVERAFLQSLGGIYAAGVHRIVRNSGRHWHVYDLPDHGAIVWGATASIIYSFQELYGDLLSD